MKATYLFFFFFTPDVYCMLTCKQTDDIKYVLFTSTDDVFLQYETRNAPNSDVNAFLE